MINKLLYIFLLIFNLISLYLILFINTNSSFELFVCIINFCCFIYYFIISFKKNIYLSIIYLIINFVLLGYTITNTILLYDVSSNGAFGLLLTATGYALFSFTILIEKAITYIIKKIFNKNKIVTN